MKRSLRFKLSITLMTTVLVTLLISILVNNVFLVDYYISGKQKSLVNVFNRINEMYTSFNMSEKLPDKKTSSEMFVLPDFTSNDSNDVANFIDMELAIEQLSQDNNINILLYRILGCKCLFHLRTSAIASNRYNCDKRFQSSAARPSFPCSIYQGAEGFSCFSNMKHRRLLL